MKKTIFLNSFSSLLQQVVTIVIGLILPRLMIGHFGSEINGLVGSISQFISYITLFEAGIGGVVRAALYKPIAEQDNKAISAILKAADQYFKRLALFFIIYIAVLSFLYPMVINQTFHGIYTGSLIIIISLSTFSQYFIGITYSIFLQADAKNYVINTVQIAMLVLNSIMTVLLISAGASIHQVKMVSTVIYIMRPILLSGFVSRHYSVSKECRPDYQSLKQRKNGLAHHIAWFLHTNTDIAVITILGKLSSVSVYSIYYMIVNSMTMITTAFISGLEAIFGRKLAKSDCKEVKQDFELYCMVVNTIIIVLFFTAGSMLMPFILLYTAGITDANYMIPVLGYCLLAAEGVYCIRIPYHSIVTAAGHFKETQISAVIETALNIILSVVLIRQFELPGIAFATFAAMLYRTIFYIYYLSRNILEINAVKNYIRNFICILMVGTGIWIKIHVFDILPNHYGEWVLQSCICFGWGGCMALIYDLIFFRKELIAIRKLLRKQ